MAGYNSWKDVNNTTNIKGKYLVANNKLEATELSDALQTLRVMKYHDMGNAEDSNVDQGRMENTQSWIIPVKIRETMIMDLAMEANILMTDENWHENFDAFLAAVQDITTDLRRWVPNKDKTHPGNQQTDFELDKELIFRINTMPESDELTSGPEDGSSTGGNKRVKTVWDWQRQ